VNYFQRLFSGQFSQFADPFPDCGLVFDSETSGVDPHEDYIVQFGVCTFFNNQIVDRISFLLQLPRGLRISNEMVSIHGITTERCQRYGIPRDDAFGVILEMVDTYSKLGCAICGHNLFSFDLEFLRHEALRRGLDLRISEHQIWDTGMLIKALGMAYLPWPGTTRGQFYHAVSSSYSRVKWNLKYCSEIFNLPDSPDSKNSTYHDALFDCLKCFQVLNCIRSLAIGNPYGYQTSVPA
jgi:DNA polymerase III epsilon subunit-like protein